MEDCWQNGVLLFVDGKQSTPEEILLKHCVQEDGLYMADYVLNDAGTIVELRYDKITEV